MSRTRKQSKRKKVSTKGKKTLGIEEKSPTMPGVVFLKCLKETKTENQEIQMPMLRQMLFPKLRSHRAAEMAAGCAAAHVRQLPSAPFLQPAAAAGGNGAPRQRPFAHPLRQLARSACPRRCRLLEIAAERLCPGRFVPLLHMLCSKRRVSASLSAGLTFSSRGKRRLMRI